MPVTFVIAGHLGDVDFLTVCFILVGLIFLAGFGLNPAAFLILPSGDM